MTHIIEGNNHLFTPDYWGGIDIATYEGPMPTFRSTVSGKTAEDARDLLGEAGEDILEKRCWEETVPLGPSAFSGFADGTIFVVDKESVSAAYDYAVRQNNPAAHAHCQPIHTPYTDYWRDNQNPRSLVKPNFGRELAFDAGRQLVYSRHIEWGVLLTSPEGKRKLGTWALDDLWMSREGMALQPTVASSPGPDANMELAFTQELFSLDGKVHVRGERTSPEFTRGFLRRTATEARTSVFGLARVRNISVISTPDGELPPFSSTFDFGDIPQTTTV